VDPATLTGIGLALGALLVTMLLEGSSPMALILLPPLLLVFGATFGAAAAGSTMNDLRRLGHWTRLALTPERVPTMTDRIAVLVDRTDLSRRRAGARGRARGRGSARAGRRSERAAQVPPRR
jgi:chemotaxis protein MotA